MTTSMLSRGHITEAEEAFVWNFARLGDASQAYRLAYPHRSHHGPTVNQTAYEILRKPEIRMRLDAVRAELDELHAISRFEVVASLKRLAGKAEAKGDFFPAVKSVETLARIGGLLVDRRQVQVTLEAGVPGDLSRLDDPQLAMYEWLTQRIQGADTPCPYELVPVDSIITTPTP